ncbi:MAG: hypothetical protein BM563_09335 [Bacteroidetes bacterium MedPE-SWsnd-G1]|nr:MAG: hypothetical protein BM563_09335 [Bacteroidetes bacterium MedPE-SWsnd-G1]
MKKFSFVISLFCSVFLVNGQEILSIDNALQIALENNYDIKVIEKDLEIAENNTSVYNSGYLPTASVTSGAGYNNNSSLLETADGTKIEAHNVVSTNYNASLGVNYVLFDGLNRKYSYKRLKEVYNLTELQARQVIEGTMLSLYLAYFEVARLSENENNQKQTLDISKRRLLRAEYASSYGQNTKLDVLNAEVDVNNDSINYLDSQRQLTNAKRNLNVVLGREADITSFNVDTDVQYAIDLNLQVLLQNALDNNVLLLQVNKGLEISDYDVSISKSGWMPTVSANGSYGWNKNINDEPVGFSFANSQQYGLNAGVSLGWNIFDGGRTKTNVQNAKIAMDAQEIEKEQFTQELTRDVYNAWEFYQNALFKLQVQETNVQTNQRNFERTNEQYKLGQISSIDFRLAQVNLLNAERDLSQSKYDAKNAEYQLLYLAGELLNN